MKRSEHHLRVVPAKAGTHTAESVCWDAVADGLHKNDALGLWVPAFAGTTWSDLPAGWARQIPVNPGA